MIMTGSLQSLCPGGFEQVLVLDGTFQSPIFISGTGNDPSSRPSFSSEEKAPDEDESSLEEAGRDEREYVRGRLLDELGREPTEEEVNEWLRHHTEGY